LTFNTANGTSTGLLSTDYILNIVSNLPKLREIFILIKTIFNVANLNEGYKGGFSSYSLFTMLISFAEEKQIDL
jgi:DNA polymerase sigma